jgi:hypothetical protein
MLQSATLLPSVGLSGAQGAVAQILSTPRSANESCVVSALVAARDDVERQFEGSHELIVDGRGLDALVDMHLDPQREVETATGVTLFSTFHSNDVTYVVTTQWSVERDERGYISRAQLDLVDDFPLPRDLPRLEARLRDVSVSAGLLKPQKPVLLRAIVLLTPRYEREWPGLEEQLQAGLAVHGAELSIAPVGDGSDSRLRQRVDDALASNRHRLLLTLSDYSDRWVWRAARGFIERGRQWKSLPNSSMHDAVTHAAAAAGAVIEKMPERPLLAWGEEAVARGQLLVCESFAFTEQARGHLKRNSYAYPERMLEHLELLAEAAEEWRAADGDLDGRFEDWAREKFDLRIAMHDKGISKATFSYEGETMRNDRHVKVDDFANPDECGRIYFGMSVAPRRLVVDYVGTHGRS